MNILLRKIFRDLRYNKGRTISVIAIIALSTALYSGLLLASENAIDTFEDYNQRLNRQSVRFSTDFINPNNISLEAIDGIEFMDYRLSIVTGLKLPGNSEKTFTAPLFGISNKRHPVVNDFDLIQGKFLSDYQDDRILLINQFFEENNLKIDQNVSLFALDQTGASIKVEIPIAGSVFTPEYLYKVNPNTGFPDVGGLSPGWLSLDYLQQLFQMGNVINEVLIQFSDSITSDENLFDSRIIEVEEKLSKLSSEVSFFKLEDEAEEKMKEGDLGALDDMARLFGGLVLILGLFAIYDNIRKLISSQRNYIGTMRALGGSKRTVTLHYTTLAVILGFVGVLIGIPLGMVISFTMLAEYAKIFGLPTPASNFQVLPFIEAVSINLLLAFLSGLFSSITASSINPREAMSSAYITMVFKSKPIFERIFSRIPGFGSVSMAIPLRTLFRNKRRTAVTIFTYAIAIVLIISVFGFMDSFFKAMDDNYSEVEKYDLQVYFNPTSQITTSFAIDKLKDIDGTEEVEVFMSKDIELDYKGEEKAITLFGYQKNSTLRGYLLSADESTDNLVVGQLLADDLELQVGDSLEINNKTIEISGISKELVAGNAYLTLDEMQELFEFGNNITGLLISLKNGVDESDFKQEIHESGLPVALILSTADLRSSITTLLQGFLGILGVFLLIGFIAVALFSFNTIVLEVISRETEFVNLRSLGASRWKISKIIITQGTLIALVGSIVTIPLGWLATDAIIKEMTMDLMVLPTYIRLESYLMSIGTALLATFVGIFAAIRHIMKLDLVDKLRTRVSN